MDNLVLTVIGSGGFGIACGLLLERWKTRRLMKRLYHYRLGKMTLDQFLDLLETTRDRGWYVTAEGYLRCFIPERDPEVDWVVSAIARLAGRHYPIVEWRKAGVFLGLSEHDLEALKGADQRKPDHAQLRLELEKRLGISELLAHVATVEEQDDAVQAAYEDNLAPWQKEKGKEEAQWQEFTEKGNVKT